MIKCQFCRGEGWGLGYNEKGEPTQIVCKICEGKGYVCTQKKVGED